MTRAYALTKLLEHGPLSTAEIITITGWPPRAVYKTVGHLSAYGRIVKQNRKWTK